MNMYQQLLLAIRELLLHSITFEMLKKVKQ